MGQTMTAGRKAHTGGEWCECRKCQHLRQIAHLGGLAVKQRYGPKYLSVLGKAGFDACVARRVNEGVDEQLARSQVVEMIVGKGKMRRR